MTLVNDVVGSSFERGRGCVLVILRNSEFLIRHAIFKKTSKISNLKSHINNLQSLPRRQAGPIKYFSLAYPNRTIVIWCFLS